MNGAEKLVDRILKEGRQRADEITSNGQKKADEIIENAKQEAQKKVEAIEQKAREDAQEIKRRVRAVAEMEMRKDILAVKQQLMDQVFDQAMEQLKNLSTEEYQNILLNLFIKTVDTGREQVIIASGDHERVNQQFIDRVNQTLKEQSKTGNLTLSGESRDIKGGFILKSGGVEINNSFEAILRMEREDLEPKVAEILFSRLNG
ncbi:MAG: V-type ATP synthase subunit E [Mahellales bacterium]|jgi:V/A-type H+-transporting ATPase subunit E